MNTTYPLTVSDFKTYLTLKNKKEMIGNMTLTGNSPIARVIKEHSEYKTYILSNYTIHNGFRFKNPDWVKIFNKGVGKIATNYCKVTVEEALKVANNLHICTVCNKYNPEGKNCGKDNCDW